MSSFRTQFPIQSQRRRGVVRTPITAPDCRTDNGAIIPHPAQSLSFAPTAVAGAAAPPGGRAIQGHVFDVNRRLLSANCTFDAAAQMRVAALAQTPTPASNPQLRVPVHPSLADLSANRTFDAAAQMPVAQTPTPASNPQQLRVPVNPSLPDLFANHTFDASSQMPVGALVQTPTPASALLTLAQSHPLPYPVQAINFMRRVQYPPNPRTSTSDTFEAPPAAPVAPHAALVTSPASLATPRKSHVTPRVSPVTPRPPPTAPVTPPTARVTPRASAQSDRQLYERLRSVIGGTGDANVTIINPDTSSLAPVSPPTISYGVVRDFCANYAIKMPGKLLAHCKSVLQALQADVEQSDPELLARKVIYLQGRIHTHHASPFAQGFSKDSNGRYLREAVLLVVDMRRFLCELSMMRCDKKTSIECIYAGYELRQKYDFVFNTPQYEQFIHSAVFVGIRMGLDEQLVVCLRNELAKLHNVHGRT